MIVVEVWLLKRRKMTLTPEEEIEFQAMCDDGSLDSIREEHCCSYRNAYFILKGKMSPAWSVDNAPITRWM